MCFAILFSARGYGRACIHAGAGNRGFDMKSNVGIAIAFLVATLLSDAAAAEPRVEYSAIQNFKNFALSVCIMNGFKSDEVVQESHAAAGAYFEFGGFPIEAHEEADALSKKFLAKEYLSITGKQKLTLMKCIDFFHSKELRQLVKKYNRK
jgi:hypothetical protein